MMRSGSKAKQTGKVDEYREIFENFDEVIIHVNREGIIIDANKRIADCFGFTPDEIIGKKLTGFADSISMPGIVNFRNDLMDGKSINPVEMEGKCKDGRSITVEIRPLLIKKKETAGIVMILRDITESRQAQKNVVISAEMLNNANDAIYIIDLKTFKHFYVNDTACEMHGYTREEFLNLTHEQLVCPEDDKRGFIRKMIKQGHDVTFESAHFRKDRTVLPLEIHMKYFTEGNRELLLCVARDITKHRKMIAELEQRENKLQSLMDLSPVGIHCADASRGTLTYVNRRFIELFGYTLDDIPTNKEWFRRANPTPLYQDKAVPLKDDFTPQRGMDGSKPLEVVITCKDGSLRYATVAFNFIDDQIIGIFNDITDLKNTEEQLKQSHEQSLNLVKKLEDRDRQHSILSEMRDMLQVCASISEIPPIVSKAAAHLFPYLDGALFLVSPSRTDLEAVVTWGDFPENIEEKYFEPEACWSLRRGQFHFVENMDTGLICSHITKTSSTSYACLPLIAKGEVLGMLHFRKKSGGNTAQDNKLISSIRETAISLSEYLSLSIANIKLRESLANQSLKDPLTGLYNRRYISEAIEHEIIRAKRKQHKIGIMMVDVDHFKPFNDYYGAKAGDLLLGEIAGLLKSSVRGSDIVCRYGGDEYMLILPETSAEQCCKRAEQLKNEINRLHITHHDQMLPAVTVSIGIAIFPDQSSTSEELINIAGKSLYRAKQEGRDKVVIG